MDKTTWLLGGIAAELIFCRKLECLVIATSRGPSPATHYFLLIGTQMSELSWNSDCSRGSTQYGAEIHIYFDLL